MADQQAARLRSIKSALAKAHKEAERLNEPVLAYFVGMAIAEVETKLLPQAGALPRATRYGGGRAT